MHEELSFGPFILRPRERVLLRDGIAVELGGRSTDLLIALAARAGEIVTKKELLTGVWPGMVVEEVNLRFHISSLRKALGEGTDGARYITTIAGRGYCFVAPVRRNGGNIAVASDPPARSVSLPSRLHRMLGRQSDTQRLVAQVLTDRFVTIVGSGGLGKTTVAVAVGHQLTGNFSGAVAFVDLGAVHDRPLVAATVASILGLSLHSSDATHGLIAQLRGQRLLLILDTCEHLIDAVGPLASKLFIECPQVFILATSREALRVEGENVYRLEPLASPPDRRDLTAAEAQIFTSAQLFIDRARASGGQFDWNDANARLVSHICRKLDGLPLAIELAAGRVSAFGIQSIAEAIDERLALGWAGQRSALPRHHSLQATLDWSYELLTEMERDVLRQLTVFIGFFTFEAALDVVSGENGQVYGAIETLIAKSLVAAYPMGAMMRYRLLDTTRAYAMQIHTNHGDRQQLAARHANYYRRWLEHRGGEWSSLSNAAERAPHLAALGNVRAALEWGFDSTGDRSIAIPLAAAAAPVFLAMSLLTECERWVGVALASLDATTSAGLAEMRLQTARGMSLMFTRQHNDDARIAFERGLAIARARGDVENQLLLLAPLHMFHFRCGQSRRALKYALDGANVAERTGSPSAIALARCLTGISLHSTGELPTAREHLEACLLHEPTSQRKRTLQLGFDYYNWAAMALARTQWMQGNYGDAMRQLEKTLADAEQLDHRVTLTLLLHWAAAVCIWNGDLERAATLVDRFLERAAAHALAPYLAVGLGLKGELSIRQGAAQSGVTMLEESLATLHAARYELVSTAFQLPLAEGLQAMGQHGKAMQVIDNAIQVAEENGDLAFMPELLRIKSRLHFSMAPADQAAHELLLLKSLEWSRRQKAKAWELRAATDLACSWMRAGRTEVAKSLLQPLIETFATEPSTPDVENARRTLTATKQSYSAKISL